MTFSGEEPNTNYIKPTSLPGDKGDLLIMEAEVASQRMPLTLGH